MEPTTQHFLRCAVHEALNAENDTAAMELLAILADAAKPEVLRALPAAQSIVDGPARDYHYWARFIREHFIPFMTDNGRLRFTSHELFSWIENHGNLSLTAGDIEQQKDGTFVFRGRISAALSHLKQSGIIYAPAKGRDYAIDAS
jgi:hypothetical protein